MILKGDDEMRRKASLFAGLLLILMAMSITPAAAVGPPPTDEEHIILFNGDDITSEEIVMMGRRARGGKHLDLIDKSWAELRFIGDEWVYDAYDWRSPSPHIGHLMLEVDLKTNIVEMTYGFDKAVQCITVKKSEVCRVVDTYSLQGAGGIYNDSSDEIMFEEVDFTMYKVILVPSKGKGNTGYGLDFEVITDELTLNFDVSVTP
jgi:hypothetical protein